MTVDKETGLAPRSVARSSKRAPKKSNKPKKSRGGRRILVFLLIVLLLGVGYAGYLLLKAQDAFQQIGDDSVEVVPPSQSVKVKPVSFLLLGLDSRPKGGGMNTDVIKVISMNPHSKTATTVSIPRDTLIELNGYKSNKANSYYANFYMQGLNDKLSRDDAHGYARKQVKELFAKYLEIPIDYTVVVNFNGFIDVVDALGGIHVDVDMKMRYVDTADGTDINLEAGPQVLTGQKALDYVRYRQSNRGTKASNDFERNQRQSQVIGAIIDKMTSLGGISRLDKVIEAVGGNIKSDMHAKEIENLMIKYLGISSGDMETITLEGIWRSPYVRVDADKLQEARDALRAKLSE